MLDDRFVVVPTAWVFPLLSTWGRRLAADALAVAVEEGAGDLGGQRTGLRGPGIELGDLDVAVAGVGRRRHWCRCPCERAVGPGPRR